MKRTAIILISMLTAVSAFAQGWNRQPTPNDTLRSTVVLPDGGVVFQIYAPNAKNVGVSGDLPWGAPIRFDAGAQAPWFNYTDAEGRTHVVWFEDARSARARLRLVEEYGLAGISIWTADDLNRPMLAVLESMYSVEKIL